MPSKKIVIAEASSTIKSVADSLLRQHGYDVVCTSDGLQAWEVIQAERPDLILIGLNLSGIPGLELCRQMSGDRIAGGIPSLLIVGANDNATKEDLISSGAKGHLKKPFSPKDLLQAVTRLIGPGDGVSSAQADKERNSTKTSYKAEILSTTRHLQSDSDQIHHINWSDINETSDIAKQAPQKVGSIGASSDDQGLEIEKDQFGLANAHHFQGEPQPRPEQRATADEDYDWFVGEIKKEVEGGGKKEDNIPAPKEDFPPAFTAGPDDDGIRFDDLESDDNLVFHDNMENQKSGGKAVDTPKKAESGSSLSESDIERIADKVAERLAISIATKIDRKALIDVVKSSIHLK